MCGEKCENGELHSNYECVAFQEAGYRIDTEDSNNTIGTLIDNKEETTGDIFKNVMSYRKHIEEGGFSPYCFISTLRCILMKGKIMSLK